jgi:hypothetical protein
MHKSISLSIGLISGVYYGKILREKGYSNKLTQSYYSFHDENKFKDLYKPCTLDEVYKLYEKGLLDQEQSEKFRKVAELKQWDKLKNIIPSSAEDLMSRHPIFEENRRAKNAFYRNN